MASKEPEQPKNVTDLLIENGILLKPHNLSWRPAGWQKPPAGWTPQRTQPILDAADQLQKETPDLPRFLALQQAEQREGERLHALRRPWPGWVPINANVDRRISKAYRNLFIEINPDHERLTKWDTQNERVTWPLDGRYVFKNGRMSPVEAQ